MKITAKQKNVLVNLHRIVFRRVGGKLEPFLDDENCRMQLNSLGARRLVVRSGTGRFVKVADPEGGPTP